MNPVRAVVLAAACLAASATAPMFAAGNLLVYFGTYTDGASKGIYVSRLNVTTGTLSAPVLAATTTNPSFLATTATGTFLYAVNEVGTFGGKSSGAVSAFAIDRQSGVLTALNQQPTGGADPAHLSLDRGGHAVLVANYTGGSIAVFPIGADGKLGAVSSFVQHTGSSVDPERQRGPHAHEILADPRNQFVYVADLGLDRVMIYKFDAAQHAVRAATPAFASVKPGSGPRHMAFDASARNVYVISEMACTITAFHRDASNGSLTEFQTLSSLPPGTAAQKAYSTAEIALAPSGAFLYGSNRGHNSISVFSVDPASGKLTYVANTPTAGKTPRGFAIEPSGAFLLEANQDSDTVAVFRIDKTHGTLAAAGKPITVGKPVDVKFVE